MLITTAQISRNYSKSHIGWPMGHGPALDLGPNRNLDARGMFYVIHCCVTRLMVSIHHHQRNSRSICLKSVCVFIFSTPFAPLHCFACLHLFLSSAHVSLFATQLLHYPRQFRHDNEDLFTSLGPSSWIRTLPRLI